MKREREAEEEEEAVGVLPTVEKLVVYIVAVGTEIPVPVQRIGNETVVTLHEHTMLIKSDFKDYFGDPPASGRVPGAPPRLIFDTLLALPMHEYDAGTVVRCVPQGKSTIFEIENKRVARFPKLVHFGNKEVSWSSLFRENADLSAFLLSWMDAQSIRTVTSTHKDAKRIIEKKRIWLNLFKRDFPELFGPSVFGDPSCLRLYAQEFFGTRPVGRVPPNIWKNPWKTAYETWERGDFSGTPLVRKVEPHTHMTFWKDKMMTFYEKEACIKMRCFNAGEDEEPMLILSEDTSPDFGTLFAMIRGASVTMFQMNDSLISIQIQGVGGPGYVIDYKTGKFPFGFSVNEPKCWGLLGRASYILAMTVVPEGEYEEHYVAYSVVNAEHKYIHSFSKGVHLDWKYCPYLVRNTESFVILDNFANWKWYKLTKSGVKKVCALPRFEQIHHWYATNNYLVECVFEKGIRLYKDDGTSVPEILMNKPLSHNEVFDDCLIAGHILFVFIRRGMDFDDKTVFKFNLLTGEQTGKFHVTPGAFHDGTVSCTLGPVIFHAAAWGIHTIPFFVFLRPPPN